MSLYKYWIKFTTYIIAYKGWITIIICLPSNFGFISTFPTNFISSWILFIKSCPRFECCSSLPLNLIVNFTLSPLERNFWAFFNLKEIKLRPVTETHDYNFKIKNAQRFLEKGDKVKFTVRFKGREMQHTQLGKDLLDRVQNDTKDFGKIELSPKFEGKQMIMIVQPL